MATQNYYTVKAGDTLSEIAQMFGIGNGDWMKGAKQLGDLNDIEDIDYIVVGQKIKLYGTKVTTSTISKYVTFKAFGLQSSSQRGMYAAWAYTPPSGRRVASFEVQWEYYLKGISNPFVGTNTQVVLVDEDGKDITTGGILDGIMGTKSKPKYQSIYTAPEDATKVRVKVKPELFKAMNKNGSGYTVEPMGVKTSDTYSFADNPPVAPSAPKVELKDLTLTASLSNLDPSWESQKVKIRFQIVKNNAENKGTSEVSIKTGYATASWPLATGSQYKVRCRAVKEDSNGDELLSDWSPYSENVSTKPSGKPKITKCQASKGATGTEDICVYLEWEAVNTADTYTVQYSTDKQDFEYNAAQEASGIENTKYKTPALTDGGKYYFRVRGSNENGDTEWSEVKEVTVGDIPAAPTTWSSTTSVVAGKPVTLYWIHNARDNSDETYAKLEVYIDDVLQILPTIENTDIGSETDGISSYVIQTDGNDEGSVIRWRVQTAGVTKKLGDWSEERLINVYAEPGLNLTITDSTAAVVDDTAPLHAFPMYVKGFPTPESQVPIGYHVSVVSNDLYETLDSTGNVKMVSEGEEIYSKFVDTSDPLMLEISAGDIDLVDGCEYTLTAIVTMDSGLEAQAVTKFSVSWTADNRYPSANIEIDRELVVAHIRPYCDTRKLAFHIVTRAEVGGVVTYTVTSSTIIPPDDETVSCLLEYTTTGETVYSVANANGSTTYFCQVETTNEANDVYLNVYRREFDGSYTELATELDPSINTHIVDPHPALDYARYRIVAVQKGTGGVSYGDTPAVEVGEKAIIIQWDEDWMPFDLVEGEELANPPWSGSMLKLPYNIDISDSYGTDNALVKYIGRKYPVSYYGTQLDSSATWNVEIPKSDKETLHALRRLAIWTGDCYVREPSGSGYWANVSVSFSQKHKEVTIPVTLNIKRVEGGA